MAKNKKNRFFESCANWKSAIVPVVVGAIYGGTCALFGWAIGSDDAKRPDYKRSAHFDTHVVHAKHCNADDIYNVAHFATDVICAAETGLGKGEDPDTIRKFLGNARETLGITYTDKN